MGVIDDDDDGPTFRRLIKKGKDEGLAEGYRIGLQKGYLLAARGNIVAVVSSRFPALVSFVRVQVEQISDLKKLDALLVDAGTATTALEAVQYLLDVPLQEAAQ